MTGHTDIRLFPSVSSHMDDELARLDESLVAKTALVWSLSCVYSHVSVQFSRVFKCSMAHRAGEWPLLGVYSEVY